MNDAARCRVLFLIRVEVSRAEEFLEAYEKVRDEVANGVPGHRVDQVCQSAQDPEQWLITSEWTSLAAFEDWERSPGHRELVTPMRACMTEARSMRFLIHRQTEAGR